MRRRPEQLLPLCQTQTIQTPQQPALQFTPSPQSLAESEYCPTDSHEKALKRSPSVSTEQLYDLRSDLESSLGLSHRHLSPGKHALLWGRCPHSAQQRSLLRGNSRFGNDLDDGVGSG
jgi:hypothetical protein